MRSAARLTLFAFLALLTAGCAKKAPPEPVKEYSMRGQVLRLDPANQSATVKHEEIAGWMGAMTMDYSVRDKAEFAKLREGEAIAATVFVQDAEYWIGRITATHNDKPGDKP